MKLIHIIAGIVSVVSVVACGDSACWAPNGSGQGGLGGSGPIISQGGLGDNAGGGIGSGDVGGAEQLRDECKRDYVCRCTGKVLCEWVDDNDNGDDTLPFHYCPIINDETPEEGGGWLPGTCTEVSRAYFDSCRESIVELEAAKGSSFTDKSKWACTRQFMECTQKLK